MPRFLALALLFGWCLYLRHELAEVRDKADEAEFAAEDSASKVEGAESKAGEAATKAEEAESKAEEVETQVEELEEIQGTTNGVLAEEAGYGPGRRAGEGEDDEGRRRSEGSAHRR
jgi:hypothetical protein